MPLVRREDSVLVVVDAQPGFFAYDALSEDNAARAGAAVTRHRVDGGPGRAARHPRSRPEDAVYTNSAVEHGRGIARMTGAGVERNHCKGLAFEWLHTVDRALETFPQAAALGTPPWHL